MDLYMSVLLNMRSCGRKPRGALVLDTKESTTIGTALRSLNMGDEQTVRRAIRQISIGDFAHLPPIRDFKALFTNAQHQQLLRQTYHRLRLDHVSIDEVTARVLSIILLSKQCNCRHLQLSRCSFTDTGRKILFSALSMMAKAPVSAQAGTAVMPVERAFRATRTAELGAPYQMTLHLPHRTGAPALMRHKDGEDTAPMGLYSLEMCQMGITDKKCAWLCSAVELQPYLQSLSLRDNPIGHMGIRRLVAVLSRSCRQLKALDLSGNLLRSQGVHVLAQYLTTAGQGLEVLDISSNGVTLASARDLARALAPEFNSSLRVLNLDMNQLEGAGCGVLSSMLARNQSLKTLTLSQNNLFDNGCQLLFTGLESNSTLQCLDISGNFITHIGAQSIREYLQSSQSHRHLAGRQRGLRTLNVSANSLGDEGIEALCSGLSSNRHLVDLIANNIDVTDSGMPSIRRALEAGAIHTPSLLTLSLRYNHRLSRAGYEELAKGSMLNRHILRIVADLQFDGWDEVWTKVEMALIRNTVYAVERYRIPLLMVARGRLLLHSSTQTRESSKRSITRLPIELRRMILIALDRHQVLSRYQQIRALNIACNRGKWFQHKMDLLAAVLGSEYPFVLDMIRTVHS
ncbi:hypothetical protein IWW54_001550 [Coemansia sp. RSA 2705]|nr:hypothetical protein IWW54_001550 [Coemansia sp. RSA 2705]